MLPLLVLKWDKIEATYMTAPPCQASHPGRIPIFWVNLPDPLSYTTLSGPPTRLLRGSRLAQYISFLIAHYADVVHSLLYITLSAMSGTVSMPAVAAPIQYCSVLRYTRYHDSANGPAGICERPIATSGPRTHMYGVVLIHA